MTQQLEIAGRTYTDTEALDAWDGDDGQDFRRHAGAALATAAFEQFRDGPVSAMTTVNYLGSPLPRPTDGSTPRLRYGVAELIEKVRLRFASSTEAMLLLAVGQLEAQAVRELSRLWRTVDPTAAPYVSDALPQIRRHIADLDARGVFVGRAPMVDQLIDAVKDETGFAPPRPGAPRWVAGHYRGTDIIKLTNYRDEFGVPVVTVHELFLVGQDSSHTTRGQLLGQEWIDPRRYWHLAGTIESITDGIVDDPTLVRRVVATEIAPGPLAD